MVERTSVSDPPITMELVRDHGLSEEDYTHIKEILGREPSFTELGIFSVMWSEHCCYKSSKLLLKTFPTSGARILQGPGENAGVVDIGNGLAIAFKMESHNHPSAVEPYQGAATGVGGILRDIFTMGARPIAMLNPLRFGNPSIAWNRYIMGGVISGIADYGNCVGVPTIAGDIYFSDSYNGNPLVNVMCVGLMEKKDLTLARARTTDSYVVYYGNATGRDGIHGATFASEELSENSQERRPAVQVGDPFMGKRILEATLDLIRARVVEAIQDMGAAGLTCSTCEMAGRGGKGIEIDLDRVPQRAENMTPYELMLSESQERMLAICPPDKIERARDILAKWDLECCILGTVTDDGLMRVRHRGCVVAEIPAAKISDDSPVCRREARRSAYLDRLPTFDPATNSPPADYNRALLDLLAFPTISSKRWVYEQYDHMVQTNTVVPPGHSASVLRIKGTAKHIALTCDGNGMYCYLNPYVGGMITVAEAARNVVCAGAEPIGITNCLNFGNPEKPGIFYQFAECVRGIGDACRALNTPVTGGNVSFYNENQGEAVFPTPVIGMLGLIDDPRWITPSGFKDEGDCIVLLGPEATHLGGSQYLYQRMKNIVGPCPELDLETERAVQSLCREAIRQGLLKSAHDLSEGGLAVALAEACLRSERQLGAAITMDEQPRPDAALFGEAQSRILTSCAPSSLDALLLLAKAHNVMARKIGTVGGERLTINHTVSLSIASINEAYYTMP
jgi:phosphoribosylformylglycinamidine synthase II